MHRIGRASRRLSARAVATIAAAVAALAPGRALAEPQHVDDAGADAIAFRADALEADGNTGAFTLRGDVRLRYGRYRLAGDRLVVVPLPKSAPRAVDVTGPGKVAACPCPDPPLALAFTGARLDEGGDLVVRSPRVLLFDHTVFWLPALWLRPADKLALLPPRVEWRGEEGLLAGGGVHVPLGGRGEALRTLDLRAAGATAGGVSLGALVRAPDARLEVGWDEILGRRVLVRGAGDARTSEDTAIAFEVDALRGDRARRGTIDLGEAAAPFDTAAIETSLALAPYGGASGLFATGLALEAPRGRGDAAAGPLAFAGLGGPLGDGATWDASAGGFVLRDPWSGAAIPIARGVVGAEVDPAWGPVAFRLGALGGARAAMPADGSRALDAAASARAEASLPLVRRYDGGISHRIAPTLSIRGAVAEIEGGYFDSIRARSPPWSFLATSGIETRFSQGARGVASAALRGGALAERGDFIPVALAEVVVDADWLASSAHGALAGGGSGIFDSIGSPGEARDGAALLGRARLGRAAGPALFVDATLESGGGAEAARALASGDAAALPTDRMWLLRDRAATGGAELSIPWTAAIRSTVRADADLLQTALLAERATVAYRHRCGCLGLALTGAHRVGRDGVDVWATVDLVPP